MDFLVAFTICTVLTIIVIVITGANLEISLTAVVIWLILILFHPLWVGPLFTNGLKRKKRDENLSLLNKAINSLYNLYFTKNDTISSLEKLTQIRDKVNQILDNAKKQYLSKTSISKTIPTFSDLNICGISQTHLYTNVPAFNDLDQYKDVIWKYKDYANDSCPDEDYFSYVSSALKAYSDFKQCGPKMPSTSKAIALDQLLYFKIEGSVQHTSNVTGGGVNLGGAVAGAVIGGSAAAIIGSQVGTETKTDIVTTDDRKIILSFYENGTLVTLEIKSSNKDETIASLRKLIPEKEESVVHAESRKAAAPVAIGSSADELRKFKELLDTGVISQEEFDAKKKQLLGL